MQASIRLGTAPELVDYLLRVSPAEWLRIQGLRGGR
jgi:hypothetical protein